MSLYSCEILKPEDIVLKESKIFKNKATLTINYASNLNQTLVNEDIYAGKSKYYFPIFEKYLFNRISKETTSEIRSLKFAGFFIKEDERKIIKSSILEYSKKEDKKYEEYRKNFEKKLSSVIDNLNIETENQKSFLAEGSSTVYMFEDNMKYLHAAYGEIIKKMLELENNISEQDKEKLSNFYINMLEGLKTESLKAKAQQDEKETDRKKKSLKEKDAEEPDKKPRKEDAEKSDKNIEEIEEGVKEIVSEEKMEIKKEENTEGLD